MEWRDLIALHRHITSKCGEDQFKEQIDMKNPTYQDVCVFVEELTNSHAIDDIQLNDWEERFVDEMSTKIDNTETFSGDEQAKIIEIWNKHLS